MLELLGAAPLLMLGVDRRETAEKVLGPCPG
jgi:hypothetical protein